MGIRNLHTFLRKMVPMAYQEVSLTKYAYKRIAIDLSIYLCKYKAFYKERWMDAFLNLITCLRENEIHFIFVFDSKSPPEKEAEKQYRILQRQKLRTKIEDLEMAFKMYHEKNEMSLLLERWVDIKTKSVNLQQVANEIERLRSNLLDIRTEDFVLIRELFEICNIPYCDAVSEAEATCAHLCLNGYVDAVLTEDTDIMAYGCPFNLHRLNVNTNTVMLIEMKKLLTMLEMTYQQFRDFCIMCGTDYNTNIPKIGPDRAYKYLKEHGTLDKLSLIMDTSILNYATGRRLFENDIEFSIPECYCGIPNLNELRLFLFKNNSHYDVDRFYRACVNSSSIIFE